MTQLFTKFMGIVTHLLPILLGIVFGWRQKLQQDSAAEVSLHPLSADENGLKPLEVIVSPRTKPRFHEPAAQAKDKHSPPEEFEEVTVKRQYLQDVMQTVSQNVAGLSKKVEYLCQDKMNITTKLHEAQNKAPKTVGDCQIAERKANSFKLAQELASVVADKEDLELELEAAGNNRQQPKEAHFDEVEVITNRETDQTEISDEFTRKLNWRASQLKDAYGTHPQRMSLQDETVHQDSLMKKILDLEEVLFKETARFEANKEELEEKLEESQQKARRALEEKVLLCEQYTERIAVLERQIVDNNVAMEDLQVELSETRRKLEGLENQPQKLTPDMESNDEREVSEKKESTFHYSREMDNKLHKWSKVVEENEELKRALMQAEGMCGEMKKETVEAKKKLLRLEEKKEEFSVLWENQEDYIEALLKERFKKQCEINALKRACEKKDI